MTTHRDDELLTEKFLALRAETEQDGRVPQFGSMLDEAKRQVDARPMLEVLAGGPAQGGRGASRHRWVRTGAWASALLAASVAGLVLIDRAPTGDEEFERLVAAYASEASSAGVTSPTSRLLEVPGMDLLRSLPAIGEPVRGLDPTARPARQSSLEEENL